MNLTGQLKISARLQAGRLGDFAVDLQRPGISKLFIGQPAAAVLKTVPYLYTLCAHAQHAAAQGAIQAAGGTLPASDSDRALWLEFLHETLWRLLLDWPTALGLEPARTAFAEWRKQRQEESCIAATQALLDGVFAEVTGRCGARLGEINCHISSGTSAKARFRQHFQGEGLVDAPRAAFLPPLQGEGRGGDGFQQLAARCELSSHPPPDPQGMLCTACPCETAQSDTLRLPVRSPLEAGAAQIPAPAASPALNPNEWLAYWRGETASEPQWPLPVSIAAAYQRRVSEAQHAAAALAAGVPFPLAAAGDGQRLGIGQAWTARGVLTHAVELREGAVQRYCVWAPTDRYFANAAGLQGLLGEVDHASPAAARQQLEQAILALDPCLPYTLEFSHA